MKPLSSPTNIQLWTISKYAAQNVIGNLTVSPTGNVVAVTSGIRFQQAADVLPVKKYGSIRNALATPAAALNGARTLTGMTDWKISSGSLKKSYKKAGH